MANWNFSNLTAHRPIHLSGVAGSAMSGLARILRQRGFSVVGTDPRAGEMRKRLESDGIIVYEEQDGTRIPPHTEILVATAALPHDHPELKAARQRQIPIVTYAEALGALMDESKGIAIAGTHGKTTTTAMIVSCLKYANIDPGFVIGGYVPGLGTNSSNGTSPVFVAEACEYNRSFLHLNPEVAVITNIEEDHLDTYADLTEIKQVFGQFASHLPPRGVLIYSRQCPNTGSILKETSCESISFGVDDHGTFAARNVRFNENHTIFDLFHDKQRVRNVRMSLPGRHNIANGLAAFAVCHRLGVSLDMVKEALGHFQGVSRRFDFRGEGRGIKVIDDYAHHPTEIRALLDGARDRYPDRRLVVVFQPHQSSRTRLLLDDFAHSFRRSDLVIIPDIYSVRDTEEDKIAVHASDLVAHIGTTGVKAEYLGSLGNVVTHLKRILKAGDLLLSVGAGNVNTVADEIVIFLRRK
jgi:UDP-N-acetylmuramate--alanine ligase